MDPSGLPMTNELRTVLFHVRQRLIHVRETLLGDESAAMSQSMSVEEAIGYLRAAINLELARPYTVMRKPKINASRAERGRKIFQAYCEARSEDSEDTSFQISELIADLLHLAVETERTQDAVERQLDRARAYFIREQ